MPGVSFGRAFRYWLRLGFVNFGGPAGQIAMMHRDLVERRRWISEERFLHALNFCMLLPGPEATQLATYVGWLLHRVPGGIVAGTLFVLPSVLLLLALSYAYVAYGELPLVAGALAGVKPVVVAIVVEAVLRIGRRALRGPARVAIAAAAFVAIYVLHVPFPWIVAGAAVAGLGLGRLRAEAAAGAASPPAFPGADLPRSDATACASPPDLPPADLAAAALPHTRPSTRRAVKVLAAGLALWVIPFIALLLWRGADALHTREYLFFTKAAFVTFGGAYAVLAYVTQAAAGEYGWLDHAQALDGLALAETTPGPLIIVLQFVGFMGGWNHPEGMERTASAVLAALLTTYATFLPCFAFIFVGGPYVERLRENRRLAGALAGVTAAVVGVILNLALVFGAAVILPGGLERGPDPFALLLALVAFLALYGFGAGVVAMVAAGAVAGLGRALLEGGAGRF